MTWQEILGRESKYLGIAVLISFLFWIALAGLIDQNAIAQEYLYARERNGFVLTLTFLCIIRLSTWMSGNESVCENSKWKTKTPFSQKSAAEKPMVVGEAMDMGGQKTNHGEQETGQPNWGSREATNWETVSST